MLHGVLAIAITLTAVSFCAAQALQRGISVELVSTSSAAPMPGADKNDATIVTVTDNGSLYFGLNPATPTELGEGLSSRHFNSENKLYIKADGRTPFTNVRNVLTIAHKAHLETAVLLTSQAAAAGTMAHPTGFEVLLAPPEKPKAEPPTVSVINSGRALPGLLINKQPMSKAALPVSLKQILESQRGEVVLLKDEGVLSFAQVMNVIELCSSAGARVALATAEK
jgi:biopolymer transport protein ExbD